MWHKQFIGLEIWEMLNWWALNQAAGFLYTHSAKESLKSS
jgi:hypothetical protein